MLIPERTFIAISVAFAIAIVFTPVLRTLAQRRHWLDEPNQRTSHANPTPRVGGLAFIVATVAGVSLSMPNPPSWLWGVALGALLLAFTGFLDDLVTLSEFQKLAPQLVAAGIAVVALDPFIFLELPSVPIDLPRALSRILAVIWIVGVVNAVNFLDGLDGLAAGVSMILAVALATIADGDVILLLLPFAAAMAGFLVWNLEPASIFMGDVGSQFAGYILAVSVFIPGTVNAGAVAAAFVFAPVLLDALVTVTRRLRSRRNPFHADQHHVFHSLNRMGLSHRSVSAIYYVFTIVGAVAGVWYLSASELVMGILLVLLVAIMALMIGVGLATATPAPAAGGDGCQAGRP